jgi:hypothetical protein
MAGTSAPPLRQRDTFGAYHRGACNAARGHQLRRSGFRVTRTGATLRIGLQADPATPDPAQSVSFVDRVVMAAVCDKLIELDAKLTYVPQLATE